MTRSKLAVSLLIAGTLALGGCGAAVSQRAADREAVAETSYPPTGQLLTVEGHTVHAHVEGHGPDLILIHGASGSTRDFTFSFVERMKGRYRVIAFDRPGLGWSDDIGPDGVSPLVQADLLRKAAEQLGVKRPIVLGHSYGAAVALAWGLRDPGQTAAIVTVSGAVMPWPGDLGPLYSLTASSFGQAAVVPLISAFVSPDRAEKVVGQIFAPQAVPPGYADYFGVGLSLRRESFRINARQVTGLKPYLKLMQPNYAKLPMPVEILHGDADQVVPVEIHARPLGRLIPNAHVTILPGIGHMPHHVAPEAVAAAIDRAAVRAGLR
ncbi:alpha/beta fold hydrolase [Rhodobacter sphaeroides]|jgi:Predicted hydrolases or acyltransferases (alpha/beta hydrolase superfamily)|uniref:Hydrolase or acyltransferase (Alpha/beta hydrolase) n=1 Tax=Cereibacter sphaeroides (strain ATCC 17023 / DSM 158 / JCM 6121 / CCUG 31486 / LMG 2827 / NBRC 12203 / NCIMB 8253 / ATH 2.4.1.) TaxID=272943 RepID=Q3J204_CERS4|nr:putative hydrolase or acyltransferase (alpha/beta hydrolase) [Cereibacter sphaeroides 2.4.1]AMJ47482.1 alpha/beta hydrolase [Cereibacter sphaeroides]ANS34194.1 alpha/beta hydrolase [Cereibacter sphaeroides]ATN63239.1 alpha/beta hydrolase [Cereibacter sphaeroides]AXC61394.1 alpha/beta hydrolase [Cereibacter sphaeroides 2.4.1]